MNFFECYSMLDNNKQIINLFGLRMVAYANSLFLVDDYCNSQSTLFSLRTFKMDKMTRFVSSLSSKNINICIGDRYKLFTYSDYSRKAVYKEYKDRIHY